MLPNMSPTMLSTLSLTRGSLHTFRFASVVATLLALLGCATSVWASRGLAKEKSAYVRVSQVGYEMGKSSFRAYLMSSQGVSGASFEVIDSAGASVFSAPVGALLGTWSHSEKISYAVYALDFAVSRSGLYSISVYGEVSATSPVFAVDSPDALYSGLLLNTLFFYQTQRDGPNFVANALRTAPGHLKDKDAEVYETPPLDGNDFIDYVPPQPPLEPTKLPNIDASGGWWDAGDYEKYVETTSYTAALMQIGIRDFPQPDGGGRAVESCGAAGLGFLCGQQRTGSATVLRLQQRS